MDIDRFLLKVNYSHNLQYAAGLVIQLLQFLLGAVLAVAHLLEQDGDLDDPALTPDAVLPYLDFDLCFGEALQVLIILCLA